RSPSVLAALVLCMAVQTAGFAMFLPLFALRFDSFGADVKALSTSDMAYALTFAFAAPFIGILADRFGRRPIILLSLAGYVLAFTGYLFAASAWVLILLRGLAGIFAAGLLPAMTSIVGDLAPENRRAQWIGIVNGGAAAGYVVGPVLGGLLYDRYGYVVPSAVSIAMAACALLLAVVRIPETYKPAAHPGHRHSTWKLEWQGLPDRSTLLLLMLITFGVMFAYAFVQPQFMFYAYDELTWTSSQLGLVMSAYGVAFMVGAFALGQLSDLVGRKPVLVVGLTLFSVQFIGLVILHDVTWIVLSLIVAGLGNALYDPALSAIVLDITPSEHTAGILGVKSTVGSLGSVLGPALVLLIAPLAGPQVVFLVAAALVWFLALASGLVLRIPGSIDVAHHLAEKAKP
ncbi:MAG TPA: MFS transporter, partial [Anaerolineae bacterium]|nr:MFS transporter [Anaerolineae bacterium]